MSDALPFPHAPILSNIRSSPRTSNRPARLAMPGRTAGVGFIRWAETLARLEGRARTRPKFEESRIGAKCRSH